MSFDDDGTKNTKKVRFDENLTQVMGERDGKEVRGERPDQTIYADLQNPAGGNLPPQASGQAQVPQTSGDSFAASRNQLAAAVERGKANLAANEHEKNNQESSMAQGKNPQPNQPNSPIQATSENPSQPNVGMVPGMQNAPAPGPEGPNPPAPGPNPPAPGPNQAPGPQPNPGPNPAPAPGPDGSPAPESKVPADLPAFEIGYAHAAIDNYSFQEYANNHDLRNLDEKTLGELTKYAGPGNGKYISAFGLPKEGATPEAMLNELQELQEHYYKVKGKQAEYSHDLPSFIGAQGDEALKAIFDKRSELGETEVSKQVAARINAMPLDPGPEPKEKEGAKYKQWQKDKGYFDFIKDKGGATREKVPGGLFEKTVDLSGKKSYTLNTEKMAEEKQPEGERNMYFKRSDGNVDVCRIKDGKVQSWWIADPESGKALDTRNLPKDLEVDNMPGLPGPGQGQGAAVNLASGGVNKPVPPGPTPNDPGLPAEGTNLPPAGVGDGAAAPGDDAAAAAAKGQGPAWGANPADGQAQNLAADEKEAGVVSATTDPAEAAAQGAEVEDKDLEEKEGVIAAETPEDIKAAAEQNEAKRRELDKIVAKDREKEIPGDDEAKKAAAAQKGDGDSEELGSGKPDPLTTLNEEIQGVDSSLGDKQDDKAVAEQAAMDKHDDLDVKSDVGNLLGAGGDDLDQQVFAAVGEGDEGAGMPGSEGANEKAAAESKANSEAAIEEMQQEKNLMDDKGQSTPELGIAHKNALAGDGFTNATERADVEREAENSDLGNIEDVPEVAPSIEGEREEQEQEQGQGVQSMQTPAGVGVEEKAAGRGNGFEVPNLQPMENGGLELDKTKKAEVDSAALGSAQESQIVLEEAAARTTSKEQAMAQSMGKKTEQQQAQDGGSSLRAEKREYSPNPPPLPGPRQHDKAAGPPSPVNQNPVKKGQGPALLYK